MGWLSADWGKRTAVTVEGNGAATSNYSSMLDFYYNCNPVDKDAITQFMYHPAFGTSVSGGFDNNRTYVVTTDSAGKCHINYFDEDDNAWGTEFELFDFATVNDHNGGSVIVLQYQTGGLADENGTVLTVCAEYGVALAAGGIYSRRSDSAEDISSFGDSVTVDTSEGSAYPQLFEKSDGTIICFYRGYESETRMPIYYRTLTLNANPDSDAWSAATEVFDLGAEQITYYKGYQESGSDDIHFVLMNRVHDSNVYDDIYYIKWESTDGGWYKGDGTTHTHTLPIDTTTADLVKNADGHVCCPWDIKVYSGAPYILYFDGTAQTENATANLIRAHYNAGWVCTDTTIDGIIVGTSVLYSGAELDPTDKDIIAACVNVSNVAQLQIWENTGTDAAQTWYIADGNNGTTAQNVDGKITEGSPGDNFRPFYVPNGTARFKLMWFYSQFYTGTVANQWEAYLFAYPGFNTGDSIGFRKQCRTDFEDIRITTDDGTTAVGHSNDSGGLPWFESLTASWRALAWFGRYSLLADNNTSTFYVYYSHADATSDWDSSNDVMRSVFAMADDFFGSGDPDGTIWSHTHGGGTGLPQIDVSGTLHLHGTAIDYGNLFWAGTVANLLYGEWRAKVIGLSAQPGNGIGFVNDSTFTERAGRMAPITTDNTNQCQTRHGADTDYDNIVGWAVATSNEWRVTWELNLVKYYKGALSGLGVTGLGFTEMHSQAVYIPHTACVLAISEGTAGDGLNVDWVFARPLTTEPTITALNISHRYYFNGVGSGDIAKHNGVAIAGISKMFGVSV